MITCSNNPVSVIGTKLPCKTSRTLLVRMEEFTLWTGHGRLALGGQIPTPKIHCLLAVRVSE